MLLTAPAKVPAFPFCSLEAKCETLMKSNLHLWMAMKRSALFAAIEKPCPHTAGSETCPPHHQPAKPPSALHPPPSWHYFSAAPASGYSTIVLCGREHLLGALSSTLSGVFQSDPRAPPHHHHHHPQHTHSPKIRQISGGADAKKGSASI